MSERLTRIWEDIKGLIAARVSEDTMERWFADIRLVKLDEKEMVLEAPNQIYQFWIETNYLAILTDAIQSVAKAPCRVLFQFVETLPDILDGDAPLPARRETVLPHPRKSSSRGKHSPEDLAAGAGLNLRYNFNSFVVGSNTAFAHAAAQAVSEKPGRSYNPLFLYGGAGLGKTHLMHAIGHAILAQRPKAKVIYVTSEQFTNEFIAAIADTSLVNFRRRYRQADVLLIDDIQFFAGKEKSQEEFFHTFNTLCDTNNKQIVMSADCAASKIRNLEHRLVSRFEWGLTAEIAAPDEETRMAILKRKMSDWKVCIDPSIIEFLAKRIRNNVRRLEGALIRIASYRSLNKSELTIQSVEKVVADLLGDEGAKDVSITQIQKLVGDFYDVKVTELLGRKRPANIALARQVAMYFARRLTHASYQEIGEAFGGRDHGTVMHACRSIEAKMRSQEKVRHQIDLLHGHFSSRRDP